MTRLLNQNFAPATLGNNAARGAAASVAASSVMGGFLIAAHKMGALGEPPPRKLTRRILSLFGASNATRSPQVEAMTALTHLGYGAGAGALYGALASPLESTRSRVAAGAMFGAALWAVSYAGWIPAAGLMARPQRDRPARPASMVIAHLIFGAVLGAVYRPLRTQALSVPHTPSDQLDDELADSFPASDPPTITQPHSVAERTGPSTGGQK